MVLLIIGAPVMFAVGVPGFTYFVIAPGMWSSVGIYAHKFITGMDSFVFLCILLFTLAGDLMGQSGMMNQLVKFSQLLVGRIRGDLAYVNVLVSMLFGGISDSAMADVSALGPVIIEMMKKDGYKTEFAAAITATTATEAAAVAVGYAFIIATFVYKNMTFDGFMASLTRPIKTTTAVYLIIAFSYVLGWIFAVERVPQIIAQFVHIYELSPHMVLFLINLFVLFNGMWISDSVQLILFAPIFTPLVVGMGIHPIHFGVVMIINVMISLITPPYGFAFYLAATISSTKLKAVVEESLPCLIVSIGVLFVVTYIPVISLYLSKLLGFIK